MTGAQENCYKQPGPWSSAKDVEKDKKI